MRILFFSHYFPPEANAPAARTHAHCALWAAAGHDVTVVTCAPSHPRGVVYPGHANRPRQVEWVDGVRVLRVGTYLAANEGVWRRSASWLSYLASATLWSLFEPRPDVVIATSPHLLCGWAGVLASRLHRCPLLLEIRDLWPESVSAVGALRSKPALRLIDWIAEGGYRAAARIVTVGEGYQRFAPATVSGPGRVVSGLAISLFFVGTADPRVDEAVRDAAARQDARFGAFAWETEPDEGRRFRWIGPRSAFFIPGSEDAVPLLLRAPHADRDRPVTVDVAVDGTAHRADPALPRPLGPCAVEFARIRRLVRNPQSGTRRQGCSKVASDG